jgi:hypothetical protein
MKKFLPAFIFLFFFTFLSAQTPIWQNTYELDKQMIIQMNRGEYWLTAAAFI